MEASSSFSVNSSVFFLFIASMLLSYINHQWEIKNRCLMALDHSPESPVLQKKHFSISITHLNRVFIPGKLLSQES